MATGRSSLPTWEAFSAFQVPWVTPQQLNINKPFWSWFDVEILKIRISEVPMLRNVPAPGTEPCPASRACVEHVDVAGRQGATLKVIFFILCCFLWVRLIALHCPAVTRASYQHQICFQRAAASWATEGRYAFTNSWIFTNHHHAAWPGTGGTMGPSSCPALLWTCMPGIKPGIQTLKASVFCNST